ncbi:MAG: hypothetical protein U0521_17380 [Anaerolineae bacterium]
MIHDWTLHLNIIPGAASFSIAVLARGVGFDFFNNTRLHRQRRRPHAGRRQAIVTTLGVFGIHHRRTTVRPDGDDPAWSANTPSCRRSTAWRRSPIVLVLGN